MPLSSTKTTAANQGDRNYQAYFAFRDGAGGPFATPVAIPGLTYEGTTTVDGYLTDDASTA